MQMGIQLIIPKKQRKNTFSKINVTKTESYMIEKGSFVTGALPVFYIQEKNSQLRTTSNFRIWFWSLKTAGNPADW